MEGANFERKVRGLCLSANGLQKALRRRVLQQDGVTGGSLPRTFDLEIQFPSRASQQCLATFFFLLLPPSPSVFVSFSFLFFFFHGSYLARETWNTLDGGRFLPLFFSPPFFFFDSLSPRVSRTRGERVAGDKKNEKTKRECSLRGNVSLEREALHWLVVADIQKRCLLVDFILRLVSR